MESAATADDKTRQTRAAVAEHIALEASRLARLANANQFSLLAYLVDMVVLEAWREAGESDPEEAGGEGAEPEIEAT